MQKAYFIMDYLNVTQGMNAGYSHQGVLAVDVAGKDTGIDPAYAPFDCIVKKVYTKNSNVVWIESRSPVLYADGSVDYMTLMVMHNDDVSNIKVGQIFKQDAIFYKEGKSGNATGNHIHLAVGKGKYQGTGWFQNNNGNWCINNQYAPTKALFLKPTTKIIKNGGYNWIVASNVLPPNTSSSNPKPTIVLGNKVKIKSTASKYLTGEIIPNKYKGINYTIMQIGNKKYPNGILLKEIMSWVNKNDIE